MDTDELKSIFGVEAELNRLWLPHLNCHGTQASATLTPGESEMQTLQNAWAIVRNIAAFLLERRESLPESERYEIIVGWGRAVRPGQGQIYKTGGGAVELLKIVKAATHEDVTSLDHSPLRLKWQKDVFCTPKVLDP
jgi:hypothetical protein